MKNINIFLITASILTTNVYAAGADKIEKGLSDTASGFSTTFDGVKEGITEAMTESKGFMSDSKITTDIKLKFIADEDISVFDISVSTVDGVVYLIGKVNSQDKFDKILEITKNVSGVKSVNTSELEVE